MFDLAALAWPWQPDHREQATLPLKRHHRMTTSGTLPTTATTTAAYANSASATPSVPPGATPRQSETKERVPVGPGLLRDLVQHVQHAEATGSPYNCRVPPGQRSCLKVHQHTPLRVGHSLSSRLRLLRRDWMGHEVLAPSKFEREDVRAVLGALGEVEAAANVEGGQAAAARQRVSKPLSVITVLSQHQYPVGRQRRVGTRPRPASAPASLWPASCLLALGHPGKCSSRASTNCCIKLVLGSSVCVDASKAMLGKGTAILPIARAE